MSKVLIAGNVDVVTLDDIYAAVVEQFCGLQDDRVKDILPILLKNINYELVFDKVIIEEYFSEHTWIIKILKVLKFVVRALSYLFFIVHEPIKLVRIDGISFIMRWRRYRITYCAGDHKFDSSSW